jgi:excisionase family DNA binding protein
MKIMNEESMLSVQDVASLLNIGETTVYRWERDGKIPKKIKISHKKVVWLRDDLLKWINRLNKNK